MSEEVKKEAEKAKQKQAVPAVSEVLEDGTLVETVYQPDLHRTRFCVWSEGTHRMEQTVTSQGTRLRPYSPNNNLIRNEVVLFPSGPEAYGSTGELAAKIQRFIHRYVDVTPLFEKIAAYYVLLSWIYDVFQELPYLRLRGGPGTGKTRFLLTVGSLCYKPIFASGASTTSPIFRILDAVRGTLIIDEGDFLYSDEKAEIVKILNNGNARGFPVLRSMPAGQEYNPKAFAVFGPKLVATRGHFEDPALESRCLTEEMSGRKLRDDIPINLPASYKDEALRLRNQLLSFRFENRARLEADEQHVDPEVEPRLNQIFVPLLSVTEDPDTREQLKELARRYHREMVAERGLKPEAQVLEVIRDLLQDGRSRLEVGQIADWFADRHGFDYERQITPRWVGYLIRKKLHLKTRKSRGVYVIPEGEREKLERLYEKYGVERNKT